MAFADWRVGCWRWFQNRLASQVRSSRRLRRPRTSPFSISAAQVEPLEARQLLTVTFHGGALLTAVNAQAVYLGSDWQNSSALQTQKGQLDQFVSMIVQSGYMDMLTNAGYNVGRGTAAAGAVDNITLNKASGVTDGQIQGDIQAMINAGQLQAPTANDLYIVYVEPGVVINTSFGASNTAFLGYHGAFAGRTAGGAAADIHYAVIAYPGAPNFSAVSQGFASNLDEMTAVSSHEIAEAVTDPNVNYKVLGWYDDQKNGEIGDLTRATEMFNGFLVQDVVNKNDQVISPNTTPPPPPPPAGLTAPSVVASALSPTVAKLTWGPVSGSQGYRIFQVIGSQSVLLGTLSSSTTSVQVTGLAPGAVESFKVEAFSGTAVADSSVIHLTMPNTPPSPPQGLGSPHATIIALTSTAASLSWSRVSGAVGYRIFWSNAGQRVLLGTFGAKSSSVLINGLAPGSTSRFLVEAFSGSAVGDSAWVSVTTPASRPADPVSVLAGLGGDTRHARHHEPQLPV